jgi:hypothetical protein
LFICCPFIFRFTHPHVCWCPGASILPLRPFQLVDACTLPLHLCSAKDVARVNDARTISYIPKPTVFDSWAHVQKQNNPRSAVQQRVARVRRRVPRKTSSSKLQESIKAFNFQLLRLLENIYSWNWQCVWDLWGTK